MGNRREAGIVVGSLGNLHREQGRMEEARAHYEAALAIHREAGNRRSEGFVLGNLGDLLVQQGRVGEAREALRAGEALLREVGERPELAKLLCTRGRAEAETAAAAIGAGPDSELCREITKLREALA